jgi:hypothetical protein
MDQILNDYGLYYFGIRYTTIVKENIILIYSKFCTQKEIKLPVVGLLSVLVTSSIHMH